MQYLHDHNLYSNSDNTRNSNTSILPVSMKIQAQEHIKQNH